MDDGSLHVNGPTRILKPYKLDTIPTPDKKEPMKLKRTESGLVVPDTPPEKPPEKPPEPPREYGPLEFRELEGRETLDKAFAAVLNSYGCQGRIFCQVDKLTAKAREDLVYFVARQLLGADWDCEILC